MKIHNNPNKMLGLLLLITVLQGIIVRAQEPELVSTSFYTGPVYGNYVDGDYVYYCSGRSIQIISISNIANPRYIGGCRLPSATRDIQLYSADTNRYALVTTASSGLCIVDVNDLTHPHLFSQYPQDRQMSELTIVGHYAYILSEGANLTGYLRIIDLANIFEPFLVDSLEYSRAPNTITISGSYAYVGSYHSLKIYDITNPAAPDSLVNLSMPHFVQNIKIHDNYAYVSVGDSGFQVIDISSPSAPTVIARYSNVNAGRISLSGNFAYIVNYDPLAIWIYNISDSHQLEFMDAFGLPRGTLLLDMSMRDTILVGSNHDEGINIYNISDPSNTTYISSYKVPYDVKGVKVSGDYAYITYAANYQSTTGGLQIMNVSDPEEPQLIGKCALQAVPSGFVLLGQYAYLACTYVGLRIVNVADPENPYVIGSYYSPGAIGIVIRGNYAFIADATLGLLVLDISDPSHPGYVVNHRWGEYPRDIAVSGNYAYLPGGGYSSALIIVDLTDSTLPDSVGNYEIPFYTDYVEVNGNYLYLTNWYHGIEVLDISDPVHPQHVQYIEENVDIKNMSVLQSFFTCIDQNGIAHIYDVSDPSNPILLTEINTPGGASDCFIRDDMIYVADGGCFSIFEWPVLSIDDDRATLSLEPALLSAYPNPFNPSTNISFTLPSAQQVRLEVFDILGRRVRVLADQRFEAGEHTITWDGANQSGAEAPSGVYFFRLSGKGIDDCRKMVLLR